MGYRSRLVLVLSKRAEEEFQRKLMEKEWYMIANGETHVLEFNKIAQDGALWFVNENSLTKINDNGDKVYYWDWIRWYPDSNLSDNCLNSIIQSLSMKDYLFICLGEDVNDIELNGNYYDNSFGINFERKIESNKGSIEDLFK